MGNLTDLIPNFQMDSNALENLTITIVIVLILILVRWGVLRLVHGRTPDTRSWFLWRKTITYLTVLAAVLMIGPVWLEGFTDLATFLGLLSAGIAVALKDWITNFFGWVFIVVRRPYWIGDRIEIDGTAGDVIDIRLFASTLLEIGNWVGADQSTGRVIHIPNAKALTSKIANYTSGFPFIWEEIAVQVTFESDWEKAKSILTRVAQTRGGETVKQARQEIQRASRKWMIHYANLSPIVYTSVKDSGVQFTLRFMCEPRKRRNQAQEIWEATLREFAQHDDIDLAYPTTRFYNNATEGKPGTRPPETGSEQQ